MTNKLYMWKIKLKITGGLSSG